MAESIATVQRPYLEDAFATPLAFGVEVGTSLTDVITVPEGSFFLIRHFVISNVSAGNNVTVEIYLNGVQITSGSTRDVNSSAVESTLSGALVNDGSTLSMTASGTGIVAFGWGLRVQGSRDWVL